MTTRDDLSVIDRRTLQAGARHSLGVINPQTARYGATDRRMAKLVRLGCATPNPHGDWYITDKGRVEAAKLS